MHWSGGRYGQFFNDYHINIDADGYFETTVDDLATPLSHTWMRNSRSIGVSICACLGATITKEGQITNWGDFPPTPEQIEMMAQIVATLCISLGLNLDTDVLTHDEVARIDGYSIYDSDPDMRWDLFEMGDEIRGKARWYAQKWGAGYL